MADSYVPYQVQQTSDLSINELNCVPSTERPKEPQNPSHVPLLHNTSWASQVTGEIEGVESVASSSTLQTMVNSTRQLPMARRGGRRGPLTADQAQTRRAARLAGICIRCRKTRIKVSKFKGTRGAHQLIHRRSALVVSHVTPAVRSLRLESGERHVRRPNSWISSNRARTFHVSGEFYLHRSLTNFLA